MPSRRAAGVLAILGPGLIVMLADTDAGSVVTAAQSGAVWGYRLLLVQLLLVPVLYVVMELVARLALTTGHGLTDLIRIHLGSRWAWLAVTGLLVSVLGALVTEFAGLAGVGAMFGLPQLATVPVAAGLLVVLVLTNGYRRVEIVGIVLGSLELAFVAAALYAHPHARAVGAGLVAHQPLGDHDYLSLVAANVGAVVMPWMLFYMPSAIVQKRLTQRNLRVARFDVLAGAIVTQVVMAAVLVATAASRHGTGPLENVGQLAHALAPALGPTGGRVVLALGIGGAALVACIVVSLAASWSVSEALGHGARRARSFSVVYVVVIASGATLVLLSESLVRLTVDVEILNAALLPLLLLTLALLAHRALPSPARYRRRHRLAFAATAGPVAAVAMLWIAIALGF